MVVITLFLHIVVGCICKEHASITSVKPFSLLTSTRIQKSKTRRHHGRATTLSMRNTSGFSSALVPNLSLKTLVLKPAIVAYPCSFHEAANSWTSGRR